MQALGIHNTYPPRPTTAFQCRSRAMGAVKLDHSDLAQHRAGITQQVQQFWVDDQFCDVVLKSLDGTQHPAHEVVLSSASVFLKNLLGGTFKEGATKAASGNCCIQSSTVCIVGLHL